MSQFRDALRAHFDESQINIVRFSQQCGIDRTTIQHMIGNRKGYTLPGYETVKVVLSNLKLTPTERKHLEELFTIEKIGMHSYLGRQHVKSIIEQIASLHNSPRTASATATSLRVNFEAENTIFKGANSVNSVVHSVCAEEISLGEQARIQLNVPLKYSYLKQFLLQKHWELNGNLRIEHIVTLSKSPKTNVNPNINLEVISGILPFAFCSGDGYQAKYYYTGLDPENELLLIMPYYLLTNKHLLLLSGDFTSAILISALDIIKEYRGIFEAKYKQCHDLIQHSASPLEIYDAYAECMDDGCPSSSIEGSPSMFQHLTEDIIKRAARWELPHMDMIVAGLVSYVKTFSKMSMCDYFPIEGVDLFARTGRLAAFSETQAKAFPTSDRLAMLESMHKEIAGGGKTRLIDSSKISLSERVIVSIINRRSLQFYYCDENEYHYSVIKESSIIDSFVDFFDSLPQSDILFSAEETLSVIEGYIDMLKDQNCAPDADTGTV